MGRHRKEQPDRSDLIEFVERIKKEIIKFQTKNYLLS